MMTAMVGADVSGPGTDQAASLSAAQEWRRNWKLVAAAASGMSLASLSTSSFGVMIVPIQQDLHWSRTQIASGPMLIALVVVSLATVFGSVIDRFGPRRMAIAAVLVICGALALMSQVGSRIEAWWAIWALVGLGSAVIPTVLLKPISTSFVAGRGLALAVVLCGTGISSFIVPSLTNHLVEAHGWRIAYLWLAGIWCAVVLPLVVLFLRGSPPAAGDPGPSVASGEPRALPGLTVREGFTSPKLYRFLLAVLAATFFSTALALNLVPVLRSTALAPATAASIAGLMGFSMVGRFTCGWLLDRANAGWVAAAASLSLIALPAMLLLAPGSIPATIGAVLCFGLMGGALSPALAYLISRHFGPRSFGTFYGTTNAVQSVGVGLGPLLANYLFDRTGTYHATLLAAIPLFAVGALLFATLGRYPVFGEPAASA